MCGSGVSSPWQPSSRSGCRVLYKRNNTISYRLFINETRGTRGPWNTNLRQNIFMSSLFSLLYVQHATHGRSKYEGYSLKKVKVGQMVKFNVKILFQKLSCTSGPNLKVFSFTSIHNNFLRFDLVCLPFMTYIRSWPRCCQDKHSDQVSSTLGQTFWPSCIKIGYKMWPLECKQEFSKI